VDRDKKRLTSPFSGEGRHCGLLLAPAIRWKGPRLYSCTHLFLLDRTIETEERGGGLTSQFEAVPHLAPATRFGGIPVCGCTD